MSQGSTSGAQQGPYSNPYQSPYQLPGATSWTNQGTTAQVQGTPFGNPPSQPPQQLAGTFQNGPGGNSGATGIPYTTGDQGGLSGQLNMLNQPPMFGGQPGLGNPPQATSLPPGVSQQDIDNFDPNGPHANNTGADAVANAYYAQHPKPQQPANNPGLNFGPNFANPPMSITPGQGYGLGHPPFQIDPGYNLPMPAQPAPLPTVTIPNPGVPQQPQPQPIMNQPKPIVNPFRNSMVQQGQLSGRVPQPGQLGGRMPQPARVQNQPQQVRPAPGVAKPNPFLRTR